MWSLSKTCIFQTIRHWDNSKRVLSTMYIYSRIHLLKFNNSRFMMLNWHYQMGGAIKNLPILATKHCYKWFLDLFLYFFLSADRLQPPRSKGSFKNHVDIIFLFFDHPTTSVDNFYVLKVDKNGKIYLLLSTWDFEWPPSKRVFESVICPIVDAASHYFLFHFSRL